MNLINKSHNITVKSFEYDYSQKIGLITGHGSFLLTKIELKTKIDIGYNSIYL